MTKPLREVFEGRRVLVTGHTGFKGSWLALWLAELGADVTGYALAPEYENSHFDLLGLANKCGHHVGDVRDLDVLVEVVEKAQPEIVFHLAAQALVRRSYDNPKMTFDTNVGGTVNVLEALRGIDGVSAIVMITSDKAYLNKEWTWGYRETDELGGHDPYSASKAAAEMAIMAYQHSFFADRPDVGVASTRAGNVIGGGDWAADRIIPDCMRALRDGEPIELRNPSATRPWQHVLDPLHGYLRLAEALIDDAARATGSWNFGPEIERGLTVQDVALKATELWGGGNVQVAEDANAPMEHTLLQLSIDKAKLDLGWRPIMSSMEAIEATVQWYRRIADGEASYDVSLSQISTFFGQP